MRYAVLRIFLEKATAAYEKSAQIACEAVGAMRTVASLTREEQVLRDYQNALAGPLKDSYRNAFLNTILYAISQAMTFFVIALLFWVSPFYLSIRLTEFYPDLFKLS